MPTLSPEDLALLQSLARLSQGGRPPTLTEVAEDLGYSSKARGTIHRHLARLRPTYVTWDGTARSISLTEAARALLDIQESVRQVYAPPLPDVLLPLIARGLTLLARQCEAGKPLHTPFPHDWQRSLNLLAAECFQRGIDPPGHSQALIAWCKHPLHTWPVRFELPTHLLEEALLDAADQPTRLCRELADLVKGGDAEREFCESLLGKIRHMAQVRQQQQAYVALRRLLIEHAVLSQMEVIAAANSTKLSLFGTDLHELYERVPAAAIIDGQVHLCGHCGWTLIQRDGRWLCGGEYCAVLTQNFTRGTRTLAMPTVGELLRVRRAIRDYIVAPGQAEVQLFQALEQLGIPAELWPGYDAYDLRIPLGGGEIWGVDVKDWTYAHLLARRLDPLPQEEPWSYTQGFYAIPDTRTDQNPTYLSFLQAASIGKPFQVVTMGDLLHRIQERKQVSHA